MDRPRGGRKGSKLPDLTKRTILMLKESHPEWGCQRISDMLLRGPALAVIEVAEDEALLARYAETPPVSAEPAAPATSKT